MNTGRDEFNFELGAEAIAVRIRWFGLGVGYVLVNLINLEATHTVLQSNQQVLNGILTLGAFYALVDTVWSLRGKVFLSEWPLVISLMEAVFIGLLCHFDLGSESAFRYYYFLSLLVCAMRYPPWITYTTFVLHAASFAGLTLAAAARIQQQTDFSALLLMLVLLGWVTWASTQLAGLVKAASRRLSQLNDELKQNQRLLERRIAERTQELQESQALLVQQEKQAAFGLLAAGIAHEVGNPLAAISSLVQMLNRRHHDDYTRERLQMVGDQLQRIQGTLHELVDFSRPTTTEKSWCDIREVIEAALSIAKYYKRKKGKQIVTRYADGLPQLKIVRDPLVQVFLNLTLNAMDATDEGGMIEIYTELESGWIRVSIRDDGQGIAAEDRDKIFQPYYTTKETGTGLGLFVCKHIIEQTYQGRIELMSSLDDGTTIRVSLTCDNVRAHPNVPSARMTSTEEIHTS